MVDFFFFQDFGEEKGSFALTTYEAPKGCQKVVS
jgi:hypothetical protein